MEKWKYLGGALLLSAFAVGSCPRGASNERHVENVPVVEYTDARPLGILEEIAQASRVARVDSEKIEEAIETAFERNKNPIYVSKQRNGVMFHYGGFNENFMGLDTSATRSIDKFVLDLSPSWCVMCKPELEKHKKMFYEKFMEKGDVALVVVRSMGNRLDNPNDPNELFYQALEVDSFLNYALAQRDESGKLKIIHVNRGDSGAKSLERDINEHFYGIDTGSAFDGNILTLVDNTCDSAIERMVLSQDGSSKVNATEDGKCSVELDLSDPPQMSIARENDDNSAGWIHEYPIGRIVRRTWNRVSREEKLVFSWELAKELIGTYLKHVNIEELTPSTAKRYLSFGSPESSPPDPTLIDVLDWDCRNEFTKYNSKTGFREPAGTREEYQKVLEDRTRWKKELARANDRNFPAWFMKNIKAFREWSEKNYDGRSEVYRLPELASEELKDEMKAKGFAVEYYTLPSDEVLNNLVKKSELMGEAKEKYSERLFGARERLKDRFGKDRRQFIPGNVPYSVLASLVSKSNMSIVSREPKGDVWMNKIDELVERNMGAIDSGELGVFVLERQQGKFAQSLTYKGGTAHCLAAPLTFEDMYIGAALVDSDFNYLGIFTDTQGLDSYNAK